MRTSSRLRLGYAVLAVVDTVLSGSSRPVAHRARVLTKPLLMPALAGVVATDPRAQSSPLRTSTLVAQAGGCGGDVALLGHSTRSFATGMAGFAVGHAAYLSGFVRHRRRDRPLAANPRARVVAALWATSAPVLAAGAWRQERPLGPAVFGYSAMLAAVAATAAHLDPALPAPARRLTLAGAALFLVSDTVLGIRKFLLPDPPDAVETVVMATYTGAQWLLAEGAIRAGGE